MAGLLNTRQLGQLFGPDWRCHYRADGLPKRALTLLGIYHARRIGMKVYPCPLCGAIHAASPRKHHEAAA